MEFQPLGNDSSPFCRTEWFHILAFFHLSVWLIGQGGWKFCSRCSSVSLISACHFRNCRILTSFEFSKSRRPPLDMVGPAVRSIAFSFFSNLYLEFCFSTTAFSSTILFHRFVQRSKYLTLWKIMEISIDCFGTQDTLKLICLSISQGDLPEHFTSTCCAIVNI